MSVRCKAITAVIIGNSIFGFSFLFSKIALQLTIPSVMLAVRFTVAFAVLNIIALFGTKIKKKNGESLIEFSLMGKPLKYVLLLALFQPVIYFVAESYGIVFTSSAFAGTIIAVIPLMGVVFDVIIMHVKVTGRQVICAVGSVVGVAVTTLGAEDMKSSAIGIMILMAAVTAGSLFYVFSKKAGEHYNPLERTYVMFAVGSVTYILLAVCQCRGRYEKLIIQPALQPEFWICILYLAVISSVIAFMALNYGSSYVTVSEASLFANLTTVISIAAGVAVLNESFNMQQIIGAAIIIGSVYIANREPKKSVRRDDMEVFNMYEKKIKIDMGDITELDCDCIVNAANKTLLGGGGVDGAIHRGAGPKLLEECRTLNGCETGEAKITGGYNLKAKYVIHTVGPIYSGSEQDPKHLADCYANSLALARENEIHTIAFPAISAGVYGYPAGEAANIAVASVRKWLTENDDYDMTVIFSCFSRKMYELYNEITAMSKKEIRRKILSERKAIDERTVEKCSGNVCKSVELLNSYACSENLCLYMPINNEVDVTPMIDGALKNGKKVWLPKVSGDEMEFYRYDRNTPLITGKYNIQEPDSEEMLIPDGKTLVIMPGAVFSEKKDRIGYGGGYYDKYLSRYPMCMTVAVCYDFQILDDIPAEDHDMRPQKIVSDKRIIG